jgi:hypothetical protein
MHGIRYVNDIRHIRFFTVVYIGLESAGRLGKSDSICCIEIIHRHPILLTAVPSITIRSRDLNGAAFDLSSGIPAAVFSNGKNGYGALSADGITQPGVPGNNPDEKRNITSNSASYYSRTPAPVGTATALGGEFDDMVVWISPNILFNRMVAAGKLP